MQVYELIDKLTEIAKERGDLQIYVTSPYGWIDLDNNMVTLINEQSGTGPSGVHRPARLIIDTNKT